MTDEEYMEIAYKEALKAAECDEVPIGAVIVDPQSGKIISKAHNTTEHGTDPTSHAEILAIRKACKKLKQKRLWDLDLYVTLEPCTMCVAAISMARIRRIIFGAPDSKGGAIINGVKFYESTTCHHRPEIIDGILAAKCSNILMDFFVQKRLQTKKPNTFG